MGQLLAERYEAVRLLGSGAMGEVWLANDTLLGRQVAIKRILPTPAQAADPTLVERMIREARLAATVHSPHIVSIFDLVHDGAGVPHVIMEFVDGESVAALLARLGRCEPKVAATLMAGVCQALVTAHGNSLRALVKHLDHISDDDIAELNIPTGIPLVYELDDAFAPTGPGQYLDPEAAAAGAAAVAAQGAKK